MTRKQRDRTMAKILAESTRLTLTVRSHPLPINKDSSLLADFQGTQKGSQEIRDTCMIDGISLQENAVTAKIRDTLTKAVEVVKGILLRLEEEHAQLSPLMTTALDEAALILSQITADLKETETAITAAADCRATMPSLLRRLAKKCKQHPHLEYTIRSWWENAQDLLPEETGEARLEHRAALLNHWDLPPWLPNFAQCVS